MKKSALFFLLLSSTAFAEEPKNYTLTLSGQEIGYIGQVLAARPYSEVSTLINKLQSQLSSQDAKDQEEKNQIKSDAEKYRKDHSKD